MMKRSLLALACFICLTAGVRAQGVGGGAGGGLTDTATLGPTVQFAVANYYTTGSAGQATITVTVIGDRYTNSSTIEVDYHTDGGTAVEGLDYTAAKGTLTFPAGVNLKTFTVPILLNPSASEAVTVQLYLTGTVNAADGPIRMATLTIWDSPPLVTVTAATNPICAGGLQTPVHQSVINVTVTDSYGSPYPDVPLTLSAKGGSLNVVTGATGDNGSFAAVLTSGQWASSPSKPFFATVTAVASEAFTATAQVTVNAPVISLSSDAKTVPFGGKATLKASFAFNGQFVADHSLIWRVTIWNHKDDQVYSGPTPPAMYGLIESGASTTSDSTGTGMAVWDAGDEWCKLKFIVVDTSVRKMPGALNPQAATILVQEEPKLGIFVVGPKNDGTLLDGKNGKFLVGELVWLEVRNATTGKAIGAKKFEWKVGGYVFASYKPKIGEEPKKPGEKGVQPEGKFVRPIKTDSFLLEACWYTTAKDKDELGNPPVKAKIKVSCEVTPNGANKKPIPVPGELEIFRPTATLLPEFGKMEFDDKVMKEEGVETFAKLDLRLNVPKEEQIGMRLNAKAAMPEGFEEAENQWSYTQLMKGEQTIYNEKENAWSKHSPFTGKSINGAWVLDIDKKYYGVTYRIKPPGEGGKDKKEERELVNNISVGANFYSDWPGMGWTSDLVTPGKSEDGLVRAKLKGLEGFGELEKLVYKDQTFKTFLMFKSMRYKAVYESYPVPIAVYSNWQMSGTAKWDKDKKKYLASGLGEMPGTKAFPTPFEPEWNDRVQLAAFKKTKQRRGLPCGSDLAWHHCSSSEAPLARKPKKVTTGR